jgi:ATP phosphoribosyltransferase regulatory subunit
LRHWLPEVPVHFDLAELRGYRYKTGMVFAAFVPGWGMEIARGGRYDDIGRVFGRARPAVGFSADLKGLLRLGAGLGTRYAEPDAILAPWSADPALRARIEALRAAGRRVVTLLPGAPDQTCASLGCSEILTERDGAWVLEPCAATDH